MATTALLIPTLWEAKPLIRALGFARTGPGAFEWRTGEISAALRLCGIGQANARSAALEFAALKPARMLVCGYGGALVPGIYAGDLAADSTRSDPEWLHSITGLAQTQNLRLHQGLFLSVDKAVAQPEAKRSAAAMTGALLAEMESAAVHGICKERGIPFGSLRSVSDEADQRLPGVAMELDPSGGLTPAFLKSLLRRPGQWPDLIKLARSSSKATRSLTKILTAYLQSL